MESKLSRGLRVVLRRERERRGWSQQALAERAGLSPETVRRIERGRCAITLRALASFAAALGLTVTDVAADAEGRSRPAGRNEAVGLLHAGALLVDDVVRTIEDLQQWAEHARAAGLRSNPGAGGVGEEGS